MKLGLTHDDSSTLLGIGRAGVETGGGMAAAKILLLTAYKSCPRHFLSGRTDVQRRSLVWWYGGRNTEPRRRERQGLGETRETGAGGVARISNHNGLTG